MAAFVVLKPILKQIHWFATYDHRNSLQGPGRYVTVFFSQTDCSIWKSSTKLSPSARHTIHLEFRTAIIPFLVQGSCHSDLPWATWSAKVNTKPKGNVWPVVLLIFTKKAACLIFSVSPNSSFLPLLNINVLIPSTVKVKLP